MADHGGGHETPHSAQNIVGGGKDGIISKLLKETIGGILDPVVEVPLKGVEGIGEVIDQGARLGLKPSGKGKAAAHH